MKLRWLAAGAVALASLGGAAAVTMNTGPAPARTPTTADWLNQGGSQIIRRLADDFTALGPADKASDLPAMTTGCRHLLSDVRVAQADPTIPDAAAQKLWASALDSYAHGATDCADGSQASNYTLIIRAAQEINGGSADIAQVARLLRVAPI